MNLNTIEEKYETWINDKTILWRIFAQASEEYGVERAHGIFKDILRKNRVQDLTKTGIGKTLSNCASMCRRAEKEHISIIDSDGSIKSLTELDKEFKTKNTRLGIVFSSKEKEIIEHAFELIRQNPEAFHDEITKLFLML